MRISTVTASHFLSHTSLIINMPAEVNMTLIAGPNGAGKSAAAQAIRLALFGEPVRGLSKKNELSALRQHGQMKGIVSADTSLGVGSLSLSTGKHEAPASALPPMLAYTLDPGLFFAEPDAGKKAQILMKACGIRQNKERIFTDLIAMGHDAARVEGLEWGAGFTFAEKAAKQEASDARARWKFVAGETYGDQKAIGWTAPEVPAMDVSEDDLAHAISTVQKRVQDAQEARANLKANDASAKRAEASRKTAAGAEAIAENIGTQRDVLERLEKELAEVTEIATTPGGTVVECPCCNAQVIVQASGRLLKYTPTKGNAPRAAVRKRELEAEVATKRGILSSLEGQLRVAEAARDALGDVPEAPTEAELSRADADVARHQGILDEAQQKMRDLQKHQGDVEAAAKRTQQAADAHSDVLAFTALADAIHGLPEKYIGEALVTINGWMAELVSDGFAEGSPAIVIDPDMSLRYGPTLYDLASESEKWRMRLALAYAIAQASQVGVLMMDEFDIVQPSDRGDILAFFEGNADVQSILIGTLKTKYEAEKGGQCIWMGA